VSNDDANRSSRTRLATLAGQLTGADLARTDEGGWTVATLLLHVAFWDRFVLARWQGALAAGETTPIDVDDELVDMINDALGPILAGMPAGTAPTHAVDAAAEVDAAIERLPARSIDAIAAEGRPRLVDRSLHRIEHLDTIERLLESDA
jgi:hypothetical protein